MEIQHKRYQVKQSNTKLYVEDFNQCALCWKYIGYVCIDWSIVESVILVYCNQFKRNLLLSKTIETEKLL